jgi:hypothetical protein
VAVYRIGVVGRKNVRSAHIDPLCACLDTVTTGLSLESTSRQSDIDRTIGLVYWPARLSSFKFENGGWTQATRYSC